MRGLLRSTAFALLVVVGCGDDITEPEERSIAGTWFVEGKSFRYSLTQDSSGHVTGFGTYAPSNTILVDGRHDYPNVVFVLKHRQGVTTFDESFSGTYNGSDKITGRRAGANEVWIRQEDEQ